MKLKLEHIDSIEMFNMTNKNAEFKDKLCFCSIWFENWIQLKLSNDLSKNQRWCASFSYLYSFRFSLNTQAVFQFQLKKKTFPDISTLFIVQIEYVFLVFKYTNTIWRKKTSEEQKYTEIRVKKQNNICSPSFKVEQSKTNWSWTKWNKNRNKIEKKSQYFHRSVDVTWIQKLKYYTIFAFEIVLCDRWFAVNSKLCVVCSVLLPYKRMWKKKQNKNFFWNKQGR